MLQRLQVREAALEMVADERTAELNALRQSLKAKELAMARMTEEVRGISVASKWSATHWMRPPISDVADPNNRVNSRRNGGHFTHHSRVSRSV